MALWETFSKLQRSFANIFKYFQGRGRRDPVEFCAERIK
jgi:hypothetical protein